MASIQYSTSVEWDSEIVDVGFDSAGFAINGIKITTGAPATPAGVYRPGAIIQNRVSGVVYRNSGSTAVPAWTAM